MSANNIKSPPLCAAVDVDMTLTKGMEQKWWEWIFLKIKRETEEYPYDKQLLDYDLSKEVEELGYSTKHINAFEFWKQRDLYNGDVLPQEGSIEALEWLKIQGFKICFVTHVEGDHAKSKIEWCRKHYPFMDAFVPTREKWYGAPFLVIDDRNKHLNSCDYLPEENIFLRSTNFKQEVHLNRGVEFSRWEDFVKICKSEQVISKWECIKDRYLNLYAT